MSDTPTAAPSIPRRNVRESSPASSEPLQPLPSATAPDHGYAASLRAIIDECWNALEIIPAGTLPHQLPQQCASMHASLKQLGETTEQDQATIISLNETIDSLTIAVAQAKQEAQVAIQQRDQWQALAQRNYQIAQHLTAAIHAALHS